MNMSAPDLDSGLILFRLGTERTALENRKKTVLGVRSALVCTSQLKTWKNARAEFPRPESHHRQPSRAKEQLCERGIMGELLNAACPDSVFFSRAFSRVTRLDSVLSSLPSASNA